MWEHSSVSKQLDDASFDIFTSNSIGKEVSKFPKSDFLMYFK